MNRFAISSRIVALIVTMTITADVDARTPSPEPLSSRVELLNGRPTIMINGTPETPLIYALTDVPGGRWSWEELAQHNIRQFARQGIRLFQVDLFLDHVWQEGAAIDITPARRQIAGILEACPDAAVFFRFHVTAPKWWMKRHPEEWVRYADVEPQDESSEGFPRIIEEDNNPVRRVSMASALWRDEMTFRLREFLRALAATPEGNALAGVQVANGVYGEWHNWGFFRNEPDVSVPMTVHFRTWLKTMYGSDEELRRAWHRADAAITTATVPGMEERKTTAGVFRDPKRERHVVDYYHCVHELVADNILHFARVVKETWPRPIITGTFYGYYFSTFGRQAAGGHLELQRILASPAIDYLSGPQAYEPDALKPGDPYRSRGLLTSIRLHGKLWLDEMDAEPTIPIPRVGNYETVLRQGIAAVRRNVLFACLKGMGLWFYDFGVAGVDLDGFRYNHRGSRGMWDHSVILEEIRTMKGLVDERRRTPYATGADVLMVYDTRSFYHTASLRGTDPVSNVLIDYNTLTAFRSGVVFDPIHIDDLGTVDLSPYKVVIFGNTFVMDEKTRQMIHDRVARNGRTLIWFYAPGYCDGESLDPARVSRLTGFNLVPARLHAAAEIELALPESTLTYTVGSEALNPVFAIDEPGVEVLGRFRETGQTAIGKKTFPDHTAWYVALPNTGVEPLRSLLRKSGAHIYSTRGDIVYAGSGIVLLHTRDGGIHELLLRSGTRVSFDLPPGPNTLVLDATTGEPLLPAPGAGDEKQ